MKRACDGMTSVALCLVLAAVLVPTASASDDQGTHLKKKTKTRTLSAREAAAGEVEIKGWATFSGQIMASKNDPEDDGAASAEAAGAEAIGSDFIYRPENEDFFWRFEMTKIPPAGGGLGGPLPAGVPTTLYQLDFTAEVADETVSYQIRVQSFPSVNLEDPTSTYSFGLFRCDEAVCTKVADLKGGYGTTGERIVVALPLQVLRDNDTKIKEGDKIGGLLAQTCAGPYLVGCSEVVYDDVRLITAPTVTVPKKSVTVIVGKKKVEADLNEGYFSASFPANLFKKDPTTVKTKTCLGEECVTQKFKVKP